MNGRRNPFSDVEQMLEQFRRELDEITSDLESEWGVTQTGFAQMSVDVVDRGDECVVTADVPGFEKDEIDLQLQDDTLSIRAEHEREEEEREADYLRSERERRSMRESVTFPVPVDEENVTATCKNGVLTVHLPKVEPTEVEGKRIEIE